MNVRIVSGYHDAELKGLDASDARSVALSFCLQDGQKTSLKLSNCEFFRLNDFVSQNVVSRLAGERVVDALDQGLVFFDRSGRLLHANRSAVKLLGDRLRRPHLGQLGSSPWASSLEPLIRAVADTRQAMRFQMEGVRRPGLNVGILPLARERVAAVCTFAGLGALAMASGASGLPHGADVVVTLDVASPKRPSLADFSRRWQLTPAEHRVLAALVAGQTVTEYAAAAGIRDTTARTHVRALLQKSGLQRITQVVAAVR